MPIDVCQYVDEQGGCPEAAVAVLRLRGLDAIAMGKRRVCEGHRAHCMSNETRARGREWLIDRWLRRQRPQKKKAGRTARANAYEWKRGTP